MEKGMERKKGGVNFIVITGPESTGKTQLAEQLAAHLKCKCVPELSREYIEKLDRPYTYNDVEAIARKQIDQFNKIPQESDEMVIFDTGLIITKVWFDVVYGKCPDWLIQAIANLPKALHLLCDTDLPWEPDSVRENGGEMRLKLTILYKAELEKFGFPYALVSGFNNDRLLNALQILEQYN